jgi:hypothetical protein
MQINTTGYLMELFLDTYIFVGLSFSILVNLVLLFLIYRILKATKKILGIDIITPRLLEGVTEKMWEKDIEMMRKIEEINRSILDLKSSIESTKPIKTNNWDSIREAFTRPTRIGVNERD